MSPALLMLIMVATPQQSIKQTPPSTVEQEIRRLESCHPAFRLTPPPINARVVWTQPFDIIWSMEDRNHVSIEFTVQYAESNLFKTREEAEHVEDFNPVFNLRQHSHYAIEDGHLHLLWRESLIDAKWKRQTTTSPDLACWQTIPASPSK